VRRLDPYASCERTKKMGNGRRVMQGGTYIYFEGIATLGGPP
jgi:hypothetical protein